MHHRTTATATALLLCACLLLTGCSARARQRDLIRNDPMYSATWDGIEFLGAVDNDDDTLKPPPVATTRCFKMTKPTEETLHQVMTTAGQNGWLENEETRSKISRSARKNINSVNMNLIASTIVAGCIRYPETNFSISLAFT